jgi:hypothetical protein
VSGSTSTKIGVAPSQATTSAVAAKVKLGHKIASPGHTALAISTRASASVPLAQEITSDAPQNAARSLSIVLTSGPMMKAP